MSAEFIPIIDGWPFLPNGYYAPSVRLFKSEPRNSAYQAILDVAGQHAYAVQLVWRDQFKFQPSALELASQLAPYLCCERHTAVWPGTRLLGHLAWVRWYWLSSQCIALLKQVGGLYDWLDPALPEDMAIYGKNGVAWLGSVSHERVSWVDDSVIDPAFYRDLDSHLQRPPQA